MKTVTCRLCRQIAGPAQWRGFGLLHSNRLSGEQMKEVNVNTRLPRRHGAQPTRFQLAKRSNLSQIRYLRTFSGHAAGTWAFSDTVIEILREAGTLEVLPASAIPLELGEINVKLPATYRRSQNSQKDEASQKIETREQRQHTYQNSSTTSLKPHRLRGQHPVLAKMATAPQAQNPNAKMPANVDIIDLTDAAAILAQIKDDDRDDTVPPFAPPVDISDDEDEYDPYFDDLEHTDTHEAHRPVNFAENSFGIKVTPEDFVELEDGDFMLIQEVSRHHITGTLFKRTRRVDDMLHKRLNEICAILWTTVQSEDPLLQDCPITRPLDSVVAKREAIFTNETFPALRFTGEVTMFRDTNDAEDRGLLICRWKRIMLYDPNSRRVVRGGSLVKLREHECSAKKGGPDVLLKRNWRAKSQPNKDDEDLMEITEEDFVAKGKLHTFADLFTGAGGMATGAVMAGLKPMLFLDHDRDACKTLKLNYPGVRIICKPIWDLFNGKVQLPRNYYMLDVMHISFPCQYYSPAHTIDGKNDLDNIAAGYSLLLILEKFRPRVVTFEQTFGILTKERGQHFAALIHQLTMKEYSVRWDVVNCAEYGNVQPRKRLIIIAACPGEILPSLPETTHGEGKKDFETIHNFLSKIDRTLAAPHMLASTEKNEAPYDPNQQLRSAITTNGGESDLHPSGRRSFTLQELAVLQSFPASYRFAPGGLTTIRKQIGNAVPSCLAEALFKAVAGTLRESDEIDAQW